MPTKNFKDIFNRIHRLQISVAHKVNNLFAGAYHSSFKGHGLEFEDVREYRPGDDVHLIDWLLTARMQRPYVKTFREERELTVMLVVDISASGRFTSSENMKKEMMAEIGTILAYSAIKNHDKVGILLFSNEIELYLKPKKGIRHILRVIRELLFFTPKHRGTNLAQALSFLGRVQSKHAICFVISDFLSPNFNHQLKLIAKRHELVCIEVYDKYEQTFPDLGYIHLRDLETGELRLVNTSDSAMQKEWTHRIQQERLLLKQTIQNVGAAYISIATNESSTEALRKFFKMRRRKQ